MGRLPVLYSMNVKEHGWRTRVLGLMSIYSLQPEHLRNPESLSHEYSEEYVMFPCCYRH